MITLCRRKRRKTWKWSPFLDSIFEPALKARLAELDLAQEIVAYCRGPYCVLSYEAVAALRARGFKARRLEDGLPEWRAAGLPVVIGAA